MIKLLKTVLSSTYYQKHVSCLFSNFGCKSFS